MSDGALIAGLLASGGSAGIAGLLVNWRISRNTLRVDQNKVAIDGFDRLRAGLETRLANEEAARKSDAEEHARALQEQRESCAAAILARDETIRALRDQLQRKAKE